MCTANQDGQTYIDWCKSQNGGVNYGIVTWQEGGQGLDATVGNNGYGNPKYLLKPDRTFEKIITTNYESVLSSNGVSKGPVDGDDDTEEPTVSISSPSGGETFDAGSSVEIKWTASDNIGVTEIKLEYNDGSWNDITTLSTGSTYSWTAPSKDIANCKIRITAKDAAGNSKSVKSAGFTIEEPVVVIDTTNPSPNLLGFGIWYPQVDEYGSSLDTADGFINDTRVATSFSITGSDSSAGNWAWGGISSELPEGSNLDQSTYIKVTYSASKDIGLTLLQPPLDQSGESFTTTLPATSGSETVLLKLDDNTFRKPDWSSNNTALDLSKVSSLSFDVNAPYGGGSCDITIEEVIIYNYQGETVSIGNQMGTHRLGTNVAITNMNQTLQITLAASQSGKVEIFSASGRVIADLGRQAFNAGTTNLTMPSLANGIYFVRFTGDQVQSVRSVVISQ